MANYSHLPNQAALERKHPTDARQQLWRPQLLVRTYIKGTIPAMLDLAGSFIANPDAVFPKIIWGKQ